MRPCPQKPTPNGFEIEAALLWSLRVWVIDCTEPNFVASCNRIKRLWSDFGLPDVAGYIDGLMWALAQGRKRVVQINCPGTPDISGDEAVLLSAVATVRASEDEIVISKLSTLLVQGAAEAVCDGAHRMQCVLRAGGYVLPWDEPTLLERAADKTCTDSAKPEPRYRH